MSHETSRTAFEYKSRYAWLESFSDDELRKISLCAIGDKLKPGEEYFDISHPERGAVRADGGEEVVEGSCFVARGRVGDGAWRKLTGIAGTR